MLKSKKGFFVVVRRWWEQLGEIVGKGFQCKEWGKPAKNPLNPPSVSLTGEKIENIGQTELVFALIMPEMDSPRNSAYEMIYGTS